ncbi:MAG TPA: ABC transporter substrate-binding protein [Candidatus Methylomirabilis sp.]|nr:ABC transporter substrate-binding protein [Candidatus Methylomirabilis sp.]
MFLAALLLPLVLLTPAAGETGNQIRIGALKYGTVSWELDVMETHGLAAREGVEPRVVWLASPGATAVALQGGAADLIVTDWIWVSRQRAEGRPYSFVPYSLTVGGVMVRPDAGIRQLADLRGRRLGVAGGPVDKSWLLLRAYGRRTLGEDLARVAEPSFGGPPLLNELMLRGDLPAVLNYWQYGAQLKAAGMRELLGIPEVLRGLGVPEPVPLLGWVFDERWAATHRNVLTAFLRASYAAKQILLASDAEWERIRPLTGAGDPRGLHALRDAFRDGVPRRFGPAEMDAAARVFAILAREGGEELIGPSRNLSPGTFWDGFPIGR